MDPEDSCPTVDGRQQLTCLLTELQDPIRPLVCTIHSKTWPLSSFSISMSKPFHWLSRRCFNAHRGRTSEHHAVSDVHLWRTNQNTCTHL